MQTWTATEAAAIVLGSYDAEGSGEESKVRAFYKTLDALARSGIVVPGGGVLARAPGRGNRRTYAFGDLVAARLAKQLRGEGVPGAVIKKMARHAQKHAALQASGRMPAELRLACDGKGVVEIEGVAGSRALRTLGPLAYLVDVAALARDINGAITRRARGTRARKAKR